jgi:hypothetical protein
MPDLRQGCTTGKLREDTMPADALVLFGAMGDLAHKKIFPALYHMVQRCHLDIPVIGVARAGRTNEHLNTVSTVRGLTNAWFAAVAPCLTSLACSARTFPGTSSFNRVQTRGAQVVRRSIALSTVPSLSPPLYRLGTQPLPLSVSATGAGESNWSR